MEYEFSTIGQIDNIFYTVNIKFIGNIFICSDFFFITTVSRNTRFEMKVVIIKNSDLRALGGTRAHGILAHKCIPK